MILPCLLIRWEMGRTKEYRDVSDMLGLKNVPPGIDPENFALTDGAFSLKRAKQRIRPYLRDALIVLVMTVLLCYGASWQFSG